VKNKHVIAAILLTWIVVSFVPAIQLTSILGKGKKGK
jgi:uncharacterized membrane protein